MQKKLIALAVAGLVSGAAFAQTNVTVYGIMDLGYASYGSSDARPGVAKHERRGDLANGGQAQSRIGFRGTEDLGNGLNAMFQLEFSVSPDASTGANPAVIGDRTQILGLSSKTMGSLIMGRMVNPARALVAAQDPFQGAGVGHFQNIQFQQTWADNVFAYASPNFSGFDVTVGYTHSLVAEETDVVKGAADGNVAGFVIVPKYANGPIMAGFSYESFDTDNVAGLQDLNHKRWNLAGSYNFGVVKVGGSYGRFDYDNTAAATGGTDGKQWMLSAWVPIGANGTVLASYNSIDVDRAGSANDMDADMWALGYNHAMSKRTNAYVTYAKIDTNNRADGYFSTKANITGLGVGMDAASAAQRGFTNGLNVGIRHNF